jgi:hypothetical protein
MNILIYEIECYLAVYPKKRVIQLKPVKTPSEHFTLIIGDRHKTPITHIKDAEEAIQRWFKAKDNKLLFYTARVCENSTYGRFSTSFESLIHKLRSEIPYLRHDKGLPNEKRPDSDMATWKEPMIFHTSHSRQNDKGLCAALQNTETPVCIAITVVPKKKK